MKLTELLQLKDAGYTAEEIVSLASVIDKDEAPAPAPAPAQAPAPAPEQDKQKFPTADEIARAIQAQNIRSSAITGNNKGPDDYLAQILTGEEGKNNA